MTNNLFLGSSGQLGVLWSEEAHLKQQPLGTALWERNFEVDLNKWSAEVN